MQVFFAIATLAVILAGCLVDNQDVWQSYAARCRAYGFTPGTDAFAGCMQAEDQRRRAAWDAYFQR